MTEYLVVCKYPHDMCEDFTKIEASSPTEAIKIARIQHPLAVAFEWAHMPTTNTERMVNVACGNRPEDRAGVLFWSECARAPDDVVRAVQKIVNTDFAAEERRYWLRAMQRPTLYGRISKFFRRVAGLEDL